jgi:arylsulfatase A-like enzyme
VTGARLPAAVEGKPVDTVGARPALAQEWIAPSLVAQLGEAYDRTVRVVVDGAYKLIATSRGERMLFNLERDPGEQHDLAAAEPERVEQLARHLAVGGLDVAQHR